jgi:hypothetical protein
MDGPRQTFRLPAGWRLAFVLTQVLPPILIVGMRLWLFLRERSLPVEHRLPAPDFLPLVGLIALGVASFVGTVLVSVVVVSAEGIVFHRFFRIAWEDVVEASERTMLGMPHLRLRRRKGIVPLSIPLYYKGERPMRDALRDAAPEGNPIRLCLTRPAGPA